MSVKIKHFAPKVSIFEHIFHQCLTKNAFQFPHLYLPWLRLLFTNRNLRSSTSFSIPFHAKWHLVCPNPFIVVYLRWIFMCEAAIPFSGSRCSGEPPAMDFRHCETPFFGGICLHYRASDQWCVKK